MKEHAKTPKEMETDVKKLAEKLEEIDSAEGIFGEVITDEELDSVAGGGDYTRPPLCGSIYINNNVSFRF